MVDFTPIRERLLQNSVSDFKIRDFQLSSFHRMPGAKGRALPAFYGIYILWLSLYLAQSIEFPSAINTRKVS